MRNELIDKDEELDQLRQSYSELEQQHNLQLTQGNHELNMRQQIIDSLEKQFNDQKARIEMIESTRNQSFEKQLEFFEQQRQDYNTKIDKLQADNLEKDRLLAQLQHKHERTVDEDQRRVKDLEQTLEHVKREKETQQEKMLELKKKLSDTQDEAQRQSLVYGRDQALNQ